MNHKIALVTGAGRSAGLGVAAARALAQDGFHVIVSARDAAQAEEQAKMLRDEGYSVEGLQLDLTDTQSFAPIAKQIRTDHGHLDVLVNNASVFPDMHTETALDADIRAVEAAFDVDVIGPWALVKAMRPLLESAPAARVVNLSSGAFQQITALEQFPGDVGAPAYSFAKHTLNVLTTVLASAFRGTRVLVNAVDPGRADTHPELGTDDEDRPAAEAAAWILWAATLPEDGPSGGVFLEGERIA